MYFKSELVDIINKKKRSASKNLNKHNLNNWKKFSDYLWFNDELNIWIDISKINFNDEDFEGINQKFVPENKLFSPERASKYLIPH